MIDKFKTLMQDFAKSGEQKRLAEEFERLQEREQAAFKYIRRKLNQLLMLLGTLPLRPEELDDQTLIDVDPIGVVIDSFTQVLEHLHETNDQLKLVNDEIQAIFAAAGSSILVVDNTLQIKACNTKFRETFFQNSANVLGESCCRMLCGADEPPDSCTVRRIIDSRRPVQRTDWIFQDRTFEVSGSPIKDKFGQVTHVVLSYHDVTDRKRIEAALRDREDMFRNLFDQAHLMVHSIGADGRFKYVNQHWCDELGYDEEDLETLHLLDIIHPDHRDHCTVIFQELFSGKKGLTVQTVFVAKDGTAIEVEGTASSIVKQGQMEATSCIFRRRDAATV